MRVRLECLGLPPRPVERQHQLPAQPLAQRMAAHERAQLRHESVVAAEGEVGVYAQLHRLDPGLVEPLDRL
ncbi:MAG TPA: hypothetical protein VFB44_13275, partial [Thermoleophilaceae bacterium]|nr:hypothetical protein [Thermoleophilaceae bacterium]